MKIKNQDERNDCIYSRRRTHRREYRVIIGSVQVCVSMSFVSTLTQKPQAHHDKITFCFFVFHSHHVRVFTSCMVIVTFDFCQDFAARTVCYAAATKWRTQRI